MPGSWRKEKGVRSSKKKWLYRKFARFVLFHNIKKRSFNLLCVLRHKNRIKRSGQAWLILTNTTIFPACEDEPAGTTKKQKKKEKKRQNKRSFLLDAVFARFVKSSGSVGLTCSKLFFRRSWKMSVSQRDLTFSRSQCESDGQRSTVFSSQNSWRIYNG